MKNIIGMTTTYTGAELRFMKGLTVRIVGVIKGAASDAYDPNADSAYITDNESLVAAGGITASDRVEVQPWIENEGRFSFASSDPRAIDLECFAHLAR